jgi:hypothetical protein
LACLFSLLLGGAALNLVSVSRILPLTGLAAMIWWAIPTIWGSLLFATDKEGNSYRFFAQRGVRPTSVWLSRQVFGIAGLLVIYVFSLVVSIATGLIRNWGIVDWAITPIDFSQAGLIIGFGFTTYSLLCPLAAYTIGQFCSMFFRNAIVAGFVAMLLSFGFGVWAGLMLFLRVPYLLTVIPWIVVLFVLTYVQTNHWLLEKTNLRQWGKLTAILISTAALTFGGFVCFRIWEIPGGGPRYDVANFATDLSEPELDVGRRYRDSLPICPGDKTDERYRLSGEDDPHSDQVANINQIWLPPSEAKKNFVDSNLEQLEQLLELTRESECIWLIHANGRRHGRMR